MQSFGEQRQEYEAENVTRSLDPVFAFTWRGIIGKQVLLKLENLH